MSADDIFAIIATIIILIFAIKIFWNIFIVIAKGLLWGLKWITPSVLLSISILSQNIIAIVITLIVAIVWYIIVIKLKQRKKAKELQKYIDSGFYY